MLPKIKFSDLREMYEFVDPMAKIWVWAGMGLSVKINNIQKIAHLISSNRENDESGILDALYCFIILFQFPHYFRTNL